MTSVTGKLFGKLSPTNGLAINVYSRTLWGQTISAALLANDGSVVHSGKLYVSANGHINKPKDLIEKWMKACHRGESDVRGRRNARNSVYSHPDSDRQYNLHFVEISTNGTSQEGNRDGCELGAVDVGNTSSTDSGTGTPPATVSTKPKNVAGFGSAESNRIVEQAAVARVTEDFQKQGYTVTSREKDNIGYDLDVNRGKEVLHVEVKGVSGELPAFIITANEVKQSKSDGAFRICIVTSATSDHPKIHAFTGEELNSCFELQPLSYSAKFK